MYQTMEIMFIHEISIEDKNCLRNVVIIPENAEIDNGGTNLFLFHRRLGYFVVLVKKRVKIVPCKIQRKR